MPNAPEQQPEEENKLPGQKPESSQTINKNKLTKQEVNDLEDHKTSIQQLTAQRRQNQATAHTELDALVDDEDTLSTKEKMDLNKRIDEEESPEKLKDLIKEIKDVPSKKEKNRKKEEAKDKEVDPNSKELLDIQAKAFKLIDDNQDYIGTSQVKKFKDWIRDERLKNPNVKELETRLKELKGDIDHPDGLAPRKANFKELSNVFKRNGLSSPTQSEYVKREGLSVIREARISIS